MRLVTFFHGGNTAAGVILGNQVVELSQVLGVPRLADLRALFELGGDVLPRVRTSVENARSLSGLPLDQVRLCAPVLQPPTIRDFMCYEGHASMGGQWKLHEAWYRLPVFYFSNPLCIYGPDEEVPVPATSRKFDYELEIAAVIGRGGTNIAAAQAMEHIAGFTFFNDWSSRDLQRDEMAINLGPAKGKDSASSLGPVLVTCDELEPYLSGNQLAIECRVRVNGVEWAHTSSAGMHHDWGALIERASRDSRIAPGDVIAGGTLTGGSIPEAIRLGRPARYLEPGDVVEFDSSALGVLRNTLGPRPALAPGYRFLPPSSTRSGS